MNKNPFEREKNEGKNVFGWKIWRWKFENNNNDITKWKKKANKQKQQQQKYERLWCGFAERNNAKNCIVNKMRNIYVYLRLYFAYIDR